MWIWIFMSSTYKTLKTAWIVMIMLCVVTTGVFGILSKIYVWNNGCELKSFGCKVYSDPACTTELTLLDWGIVEVGASKTVTVYVKLTGNTEGQMYLFKQTFNPTGIETYLTIDWNISGFTFYPPDTPIPCEITLTIDPATPNTYDTFSFQLVVQAYSK